MADDCNQHNYEKPRISHQIFSYASFMLCPIQARLKDDFKSNLNSNDLKNLAEWSAICTICLHFLFRYPWRSKSNILE